ncbi:hypothetical protein AVEN_111864-1 [Araneus ventricosus]|uniref:Uncharacterized protein n=1 Tax=Araneus ventricosus TaxID=182803 RepID=A0A4Y2BX10_ARAVE|nr:hypothetical protein AVEN_111864-1 [Araneus ventricosus]
MQQAMEDDDLSGTLIFSNEATFHLSGKVNRHNVRMWGTVLPHVIVEQERDSPKVNVFCAISETKLYGPFFFIKAPRHWSTIICDFLNRELPYRWIRCAGLDDVPLLPWPPRSPDLAPCDFFLWGYVKDKVYIPPMPTTLQALQERITAAVTDIDGNMLLNIWMELDYRWDVCQLFIIVIHYQRIYFSGVTEPSVLSLLIDLYHKGGVKSLFAGMMPRVLKIAPACAIMISSYEVGKVYFSERRRKLSPKEDLV